MDDVVDKTLASPRDDLEKKGGELTLREALALKGASRKYIRDQVITVLLAAKDPTAILITRAIYKLSHNPEIFWRLRAEIRDTIGFTVLPGPSLLRNMKLLRAVVKDDEDVSPSRYQHSRGQGRHLPSSGRRARRHAACCRSQRPANW